MRNCDTRSDGSRRKKKARMGQGEVTPLHAWWLGIAMQLKVARKEESVVGSAAALMSEW